MNQEQYEDNMRLRAVEIAIVELTTLNKAQEKHNEHYGKTMDSLVTHLEKFATTTEVQKIKDDVNSLGGKLTKAITDTYVKEAAMQQMIYTNRKELDSLGQGRLWKGLTAAIGVSVGIFGYLYLDVMDIVKKGETTLIHQTKVESFMATTKKQLAYMNKNLRRKGNGVGR